MVKHRQFECSIVHRLSERGDNHWYWHCCDIKRPTFDGGKENLVSLSRLFRRQIIREEQSGSISCTVQERQALRPREISFRPGKETEEIASGNGRAIIIEATMVDQTSEGGYKHALHEGKDKNTLKQSQLERCSTYSPIGAQ